MRIFAACLCLLCLTACAGSAYRLPEVNDADVKAMKQKMAENPVPLKVYERSDQAYEQKLAKITNHLKKHAKPLCDYAEYESCYFKTVYSPDNTVNAYASEGYKITVHQGLLQYLESDDEIAAVLAHEMGHHLAKHNEEKQQNAAVGAAVTGIMAAVLIGAASANNPYYNTQYQQQQNQQTLEDMMAAGAYLGALSYSKEQEREADLLSTYLLSGAGYDLKRAQNIMTVLSESSGETDISKSAFLDSHPGGVERIVAWEKAIEEIQNNPTKLPYAAKNAKPKNVKAQTQTKALE